MYTFALTLFLTYKNKRLCQLLYTYSYHAENDEMSKLNNN